MWPKDDEDKKDEEQKKAKQALATDAIKEIEEEDDGESEDEISKNLDNSLDVSPRDSDKEQPLEGDGNEETFLSLDDALS